MESDGWLVPPTEIGGSTVDSQQGIKKQEEIAPFDVQCQERGRQTGGVFSGDSGNHFTSKVGQVYIHVVFTDAFIQSELQVIHSLGSYFLLNDISARTLEQDPE